MKNKRYLTTLILGAIVGALATTAIFVSVNKPVIIEFQGVVKLDSATYKNYYLTNAFYLEYPIRATNRIYLRVDDDDNVLNSINSVIGKSVIVNGEIKTVSLGKDFDILELNVLKIKEHSE